MQKCDLCGKRAATLTDRTVVNNGMVVYRFCKECYTSVLKSGLSAFEVMQRLHASQGRICANCGWTSEDFQVTFTFGCPDCYREMRELAEQAVISAQGRGSHKGKSPQTTEK